MPKSTICRYFKYYLFKAGLSKDYRMYDLIRNYATRVIDVTGNIELVKELLGYAL